MIKTVFIDLDDTLLDTQANNQAALRVIYDRRGWKSTWGSFEALLQEYLPANQRMWSLYQDGLITKRELTIGRFGSILRPIGISEDSEVLAFNEEFLAEASSDCLLIPGAVELMAYLHSLYKVVIVSNGFVEVQYKKLRTGGLDAYVDHVVLSEQVKANKPNPQIFSRALSVSRSKRSETIMIGDSWHSDILGAQSSNLPSIWYNPRMQEIPHGFTPRQPIYQVDTLEAIPGLMRRLLPF